MFLVQKCLRDSQNKNFDFSCNSSMTKILWQKPHVVCTSALYANYFAKNLHQIFEPIDVIGILDIKFKCHRLKYWLITMKSRTAAETEKKILFIFQIESVSQSSKSWNRRVPYKMVAMRENLMQILIWRFVSGILQTIGLFTTDLMNHWNSL